MEGRAGGEAEEFSAEGMVGKSGRGADRERGKKSQTQGRASGPRIKRSGGEGAQGGSAVEEPDQRGL